MGVELTDLTVRAVGGLVFVFPGTEQDVLSADRETQDVPAALDPVTIGLPIASDGDQVEAVVAQPSVASPDGSGKVR